MFPSLIPQKKWNTERRNVRADDFVAVQNRNAIRGTWSIGRIIEVFPGSDSKVRNVSVETPKGVYERSVAKIAIADCRDFQMKVMNKMRDTLSSGRSVSG